MPLNPLGCPENKQFPERESRQYEVPCQHHYEYIDKAALSLTETYEYADIDGTHSNNQDGTLGPDNKMETNAGETPYTSMDKLTSDFTHEDTHEDYVTPDPSYVPVIG